MFEVYAVITMAIFSGLVLAMALGIVVIMNKKFMTHYMTRWIDISKEAMKMLVNDEIGKRTEDSEATATWQEIV